MRTEQEQIDELEALYEIPGQAEEAKDAVGMLCFWVGLIVVMFVFGGGK